jgi:hypothetical protein
MNKEQTDYLDAIIVDTSSMLTVGDLTVDDLNKLYSMSEDVSIIEEADTYLIDNTKEREYTQ